jgi:hypothetical protein
MKSKCMTAGNSLQTLRDLVRGLAPPVGKIPVRKKTWRGGCESATREIGNLLPNDQRQFRTCLRDALRTVPRVGRSCEQFQDGFCLHLLQSATNCCTTGHWLRSNAGKACLSREKDMQILRRKAGGGAGFLQGEAHDFPRCMVWQVTHRWEGGFRKC